MTLRTLASDPLLLKELASQSRRCTRPGWTYPGPIWFLVVTLVPALAYVKLRWAGENGAGAGFYFALGACLHLWLVALRSALYTSTSMALEVRRGTLPVLLSTPLSPVRSLTAKLVACVLPLWGEIACALPFSLALYAGYGGMPAGTILGTAAFLWATSVLFGGLGLWLGSFLSEPEKAAGTSRILVVVLLLATLLPEGLQLPWPILVVGLLLWVCLVWLPQVRPSQAVQGSIAALLMLLGLPVIYHLASDLWEPELSAINPLYGVYRLCNPKEFQAAVHLGPVALAYLALGLVLIHLTLKRARHLT